MNLGKSVDIFGKSVPIAMIALAVMAIPVAAATLEYFGTVEGEATVDQAILVNDGSDATETYSIVGGETETSIHNLLTQTSVPVGLEFNRECTSDTGSCTGVHTSYQLVTTAFAKGDASAEWTEDGNGIHLEIRENDTPAVALVPEEVEVSGLTDEWITIDSTEDKAYGQLLIDLDTEDFDSVWGQVEPYNGDYALFVYESEGEFVDTHIDDLEGIYDYIQANWTDAEVTGVKAQLYQPEEWPNWDEELPISDTVTSIEFYGDEYQVVEDDRTPVDVTGESFTMPPLPEEKFEFRITNEFDKDIEGGNYTITTNVELAE